MRSWGRGLWLSAILNPRAQGAKYATCDRPGRGTGGRPGKGGTGGRPPVASATAEARFVNGLWSPCMTPWADRLAVSEFAAVLSAFAAAFALAFALEYGGGVDSRGI